jgi:glutathione synthase/RimK-type ligase-like ATP-grasp enzyme
MAEPFLGILTLYLNDRKLLEERPVYQKMTVAGRKLGLNVAVFTPEDVNEQRHRIYAHVYDLETGKWTRRWMSFPDLIFDRCRLQNSDRFKQLLRFRSTYGHLLYLNKPLRNKWTIYSTLSRDSRFLPHLPRTRLYVSSRDLHDWLRRYPLVYLKPANGTGGRGILRIQREKSGFLIQGRDQSRRIISPRRVMASGLLGKLSSWDLKGKRYLVQQGIQLKLGNGRVHDYRMLVQKNGSGEWEVTGYAGRIGAPGSVTSNLHGGGRAASADALLISWIGAADKAERIKEKAGELGLDIAKHLEATYSSLCELALDLAIDRTGHIWLLEVNPKPAREVFAKVGDKETYHKAIVRPLEYALWLYSQKQQTTR